MSLTYAGLTLRDDHTLGEYCVPSGGTIIQAKIELTKIPVIVISFEPDMISYDTSKEARA